MCDWCARMIEKGSEAWTYAYTDCNKIFTVRMHPECHQAMDQAFREKILLADDTWTPGDFKRGCVCTGACERCDKLTQFAG